MLDFMRKHAQSWMIKAALGAIVVVFVFWGIWAPHEARERDVVKIGDQAITVTEVKNYYQNLRERYQSVYRDNLTDDMVKKLGLKEKALEALVNRALLLQEARRLKLTVAPEEIQAVVQTIPAFQKDGVFNKAVYQAALQRARLTPAEFEAGQKQMLLISKVQNILVSSTKVSDRELLEAYRQTFEKVDLDVLFIRPDLQQVSITPEELKEYFSKHREEFKIPARVQIRYLLFDPKNYTKDVQVTSKEIENYYQNNQDKFGQPKQVKVRHILIKGDAKNPESAAEARKKAESVRAEALKGKDFAALAKEYSEDPGTKNTGGDLGFISRGQVVPEFEAAAFSLKAGTISDVIQTPYGFHILKVDEIQEAKVQTLDKVKGQVETLLRTRKARELAHDEADQAYAAGVKDKKLENFAREKNLSLKETGFFSAGDQEKLDAKLKESALSLSKGDVSPVLRVGENFGVLQVVDKQEPRTPELKEVETQVTAALRGEKQKEKASVKAKDTLEKLKKGADFKSLAAQEGLTIENTGYFERASYPPKVEANPDMPKMISPLTAKNPYAEAPLFLNGKYAIFRLKGVKEIDQTQFNSQKENYRRALLQQKQEMVLMGWLDELLKEAKAQGKYTEIKKIDEVI